MGGFNGGVVWDVKQETSYKIVTKNSYKENYGILQMKVSGKKQMRITSCVFHIRMILIRMWKTAQKTTEIRITYFEKEKNI